MVDIYAVATSEDGTALHIWIPADKIPSVPFIEEQLARRAQLNIALYTAQIVETHKVRITYPGDDIPTLLQHLEETYYYTLSQITDIVLWCGKRISQDKCLELLMKACV